MKTVSFFLPLLLLIVFYSCSLDDTAKEPPADVAKDSANFTTVQWLDSGYNFGTVVQGEMVHIKYTCKNTGTKPLFIYYVRPGCGCTVADYTKSAILPGKTGEVDAQFDSNHGSPGDVTKSISVETNTTNTSPRLMFFGTVKPKPDSTGTTKKSS